MGGGGLARVMILPHARVSFHRQESKRSAASVSSLWGAEPAHVGWLRRSATAHCG